MRKRPGRRGLLLIALPLVLVATVVALLPTGIRYGAEHWLQSQGLETRIENIDLNLFTRKAAIHNAQARNSEGRGFTLQRIALHWQYLPLFSQRLHLAELDVRGLQLDVARQEDSQQLEVAGIAPATSEANDTESGAWGFGLDTARIDTTTINYTDPLLRQSITLQASTLSDIATWTDNQPIAITSRASMAGGELDVQGHIQPFGETISVELQIQAEALPLATAAPFMPGDDIRLDGLLHTDLAVSLTYAANSGLHLSLSGDSRLRQYQAGLTKPAFDMGGDLTHWQGDLLIQLPTDGNLTVEGQGKLAASDLHVFDRKQATELLALSTLDVATVRIAGINDIQLDRVVAGAGQALTSAFQVESAAPISRWQRIEITPLHWQNSGLKLGTVQLDGVQSDLKRDSEDQWNILQAINASFPSPAASEEISEETETTGDLQPLQIAGLVLGGDSRISVQDNSVDPALTIALEELQLGMGGLDNRQPQQTTPLNINARVGDYGRLELAGDIRPFATPPDAMLKGQIKGVDTVPLSGFSRQLVGHRIRQGTVSGDLKIDIQQGRLDSSIDLVLNKVQIAAVKGEAGQFESEMGLPLNAALNLLRDRDDNIRLKLPITGELDKPEFNINNIIRKAIFKGVSTAALAFYSPLGVVTVGDKLLQLATALRFDPIPFAPGQAELTADSTAQIATLTDALLQRPKLQITLCAILPPSDRQAIADQIAGESTRLFGLYRPDADPEAVPKERLLALGRERMRAVGNYLSTHGIAADRLILCDGEISDDPAAKPGVSIQL